MNKSFFSGLLSKISIKFENNKLLSMLKKLIRIIIYIIIQLCYKWKFVIFILVLFLLKHINNHKDLLFNFFNNDFIKGITFYQFHKNMYLPLYVIEIIILVLLLASLIKYFRLKDYKQNKFRKIRNLKNGLGETPYLTSINRLFYNFRITKLKINMNGIGIDKFLSDDFKTDFESAFNKVIIDRKTVENSKDKVEILTASPRYKIPDIINWNDKYLKYDDHTYILGENLKGKVYADINKTPHFLVGGVTNSGKSALIENLIYQSIRKGFIVRIADPKGVDFTEWNNITINENRCYFTMNFDNQCKVSTELKDILEDLKDIKTELKTRKIQFHANKCKNINAYNKLKSKEWSLYHSEKYKPLSRIIFVFDEVNELMVSQDKKLISEIENILMEIATRGRAFGIHLILGTQRPDCDLLKGQIRSNLDVRICGRTADRGLSEIVLGKGNYDADILIGKEECGMFVTNNSNLFRGYWFDSAKELKKYTGDKYDFIY